jgi:hypothetical protein
MLLKVEERVRWRIRLCEQVRDKKPRGRAHRYPYTDTDARLEMLWSDAEMG